MLNPAHICFDLDGTLIDSAPQVLFIINQMRQKIGLAHLELTDLIPYLSLGGIQMIEATLNCSAEDAEARLTQFRSLYQGLDPGTTKLYRGVEFVLSKLSKSGIRLTICTNKPRKLAEKVINEAAIRQRFDFLCAGDDLHTKKPSIDNLLACCNAVNVRPSSTWLVGDSTVDQNLALQTGVPFIFHKSGYDDGVQPQKCYMTFATFADFPYFPISG
jgi:phosphoglycolate phosphatase